MFEFAPEAQDSGNGASGVARRSSAFSKSSVGVLHGGNLLEPAVGFGRWFANGFQAGRRQADLFKSLGVFAEIFNHGIGVRLGGKLGFDNGHDPDGGRYRVWAGVRTVIKSAGGLIK